MTNSTAPTDGARSPAKVRLHVGSDPCGGGRMRRATGDGHVGFPRPPGRRDAEGPAPEGTSQKARSPPTSRWYSITTEPGREPSPGPFTEGPLCRGHAAGLTCGLKKEKRSCRTRNRERRIHRPLVRRTIARWLLAVPDRAVSGPAAACRPSLPHVRPGSPSCRAGPPINHGGHRFDQARSAKPVPSFTTIFWASGA